MGRAEGRTTPERHLHCVCKGPVVVRGLGGVVRRAATLEPGERRCCRDSFVPFALDKPVIIRTFPRRKPKASGGQGPAQGHTAEPDCSPLHLLHTHAPLLLRGDRVGGTVPGALGIQPAARHPGEGHLSQPLPPVGRSRDRAAESRGSNRLSGRSGLCLSLPTCKKHG